MRIAALMTCYNRRDTTLRCLRSLMRCALTAQDRLDVYVVDDGCTDGTAEAISNAFPVINIIKGTGSLFWSGGMRLAWQIAAKGKYDYYLWVNDDIILKEDAIVEMMAIAEDKTLEPIGAVVGCFSDASGTMLTYGGRSKSAMLFPNGTPQKCVYMHGNFVLVPGNVYEKIGAFPSYLKHGLGDTEFGFRAARNGYGCWITRSYVGHCDANTRYRRWFDTKETLRNRWRLYWDILGAGGCELLKFRKEYFKFKWPMLTLIDIIHIVCPWPFEYIVSRRGRLSKITKS